MPYPKYNGPDEAKKKRMDIKRKQHEEAENDGFDNVIAHLAYRDAINAVSADNNIIKRTVLALDRLGYFD